MIGRLMQLVQNTNITSALRSGCKNSQTELILTDSLGTTEREKNSAAPNLAHSLQVQASITLQSISYGFFMLRKGRWIQHDEVISIISFI